MNPPPFGLLRPRRGVALVIVLCFIVLLAGLIVAYFVRSTTERQVSNVSASDTKVELLADSALDVIIGDLKREIVSSSNSILSGSGSTAIYMPISGTNAIPWRSGTLANLIRCSSNAADLQTPAWIPQTRAANVKTTSTSYNGRSVNIARWNLHYLLPLKSGSDSTPDTTSFSAPDWVIFTRSGPANGATLTSASIQTLSNSGTSNTSYAIGRYAYAIYDEGGLLDVNAAGYPSITSGSQSSPKGGIAYADLTQLKDSSGNPLFTSAQIDQIVGWRNYATTQATGTFPNLGFSGPAAATNYLNLVTSSSNSFLSVYGTNTYNGDTDHAFMTRQQLIKLLQGIATTGTQQIQFENALQYLGTFSREVNGPTWGALNYPYDNASPAVAAYYAGQQTGTASNVYNPFILIPKVKSAFTRGDGSQAIPGEPLVKNRFPLDKLALLEKFQGPNTLSATDSNDIQRYFGLDVATDGTVPGPSYRHWVYPTTNGSYTHGVLSGTGGIMSLNDVATVNREPDFFELLQAGMLAGSLGKGKARSDVLAGAEAPNDASYYSYPGFIDPDSKLTYQVFQIGANIANQWDSDNYPVTVTYTPTGDSFYGIADLPYINQFLFCARGPGTYGTPYTQTYNYYVCFALWNPNQQLLTSSTGYPTNFQLSPLVAAGASSPISSNDIISDSYSIQLVATGPNKFKEYWFWNGLTKTWGQAMAEHFADTPSHGIIPFTTSTNQYRTPTLSGSIALNQMYGFPTGSQVIDGGSTTWQQVATSSSYQCNWDFHISIVYRIQYQDGSGGWRTYGTFIGMDNPSSPLPGTGYRQGGYYSFSTTTQNGWFNCPKSDPRTFRFGSGQGSSTLLPPGTAGRSLTPVASGTIGLITQEEPFGCSSSGNPYRFDLWAENSSSGGPPNSNYNNPSYPDNDSLVRPGDAINCYPANSPLFDSGSAARPVILNRPFRSVGELGYVFRNMPWKTLDFFSAYSADAPLLDLFTLNGNQPVLAGRLDPNTRQSGVLQAVISGATQASGSGGTTVTPQNAAALASAIVTHSQAQPFTNRADLVTGLMSDGTFAKTLAGVTTTKTEQEAVIRALADCSNTRTWNLLIDLVVQVGKYPAPASSLGQFLVEGERHYWLHVAIDRYTGKVIDKQLEVVRE